MKKICLIALTFLNISGFTHSASAQAYPDVSHDSLRQLSKGWNTWNYRSMLSHVLLPDGLALNINFRPAVLGTPYDPNYFYDNMTVDKTGMVRPIAHTADGSYTHIIISNWKGNTIDVRSSTVNGDVFILVDPIERSATKFFVELETGIFWNMPGTLTRDGDIIRATTKNHSFTIRATRSQTIAARPYSSPYFSCLADTLMAFYTGAPKTLADIKKIIDTARSDYDSSAKRFGDMADAYQATLSVLAWNNLYDADQNRVITPVTRGWNEAWQGFVLFEWDTYFASLLWGLDNKYNAYSNVFAITKPVNRYGAVAFTQQPRNQLADNSQPPVGSMVCWLLYEKYHDKWFIEEVYDELLSWNRWWINNRQNRGYITWGASWNGANVQDGAWESGLDNSPMYEDVKMENVGPNSLFNLADVGLNSMYTADCQYLIKMAELLGKKEDSKELKAREKEFRQKVQTLWSEEKGMFLNKFLDTNTASERLSPTLFYPMMAGIPNEKQAQRMLKEHFYNPNEFHGDFMLPSCARNDKSFDNNYWRGSIWGPMNFLVYMGLRQYDKAATAELTDKSYRLFTESWQKHRYVFENINSEKGVTSEGDQVNCDPYYHWGALMGLMKFMEEGKY